MKNPEECSCNDGQRKDVPLSNADLADRIMRLQVIINTEVISKIIRLQRQFDDVYDRLELLESKGEEDE